MSSVAQCKSKKILTKENNIYYFWLGAWPPGALSENTAHKGLFLQRFAGTWICECHFVPRKFGSTQEIGPRLEKWHLLGTLCCTRVNGFFCGHFWLWITILCTTPTRVSLFATEISKHFVRSPKTFSKTRTCNHCTRTWRMGSFRQPPSSVEWKACRHFLAAWSAETDGFQYAFLRCMWWGSLPRHNLKQDSSGQDEN